MKENNEMTVHNVAVNKEREQKEREQKKEPSKNVEMI